MSTNHNTDRTVVTSSSNNNSTPSSPSLPSTFNLLINFNYLNLDNLLKSINDSRNFIITWFSSAKIKLFIQLHKLLIHLLLSSGLFIPKTESLALLMQKFIQINNFKNDKNDENDENENKKVKLTSDSSFNFNEFINQHFKNTIANFLINLINKNENDTFEFINLTIFTRFINTFFNFYHLKNLKNLNENLNENMVDQNEKENLKNYFIKKFATIILFIAEEVTELSFNTTIDFRSNVITCKFIEFAVNCDQDLLAISYLNNLQNIVDFSLNDFTTFTLQNVYFFKKLPKELFPTILKFITNYKNLLNLRLVNKYFNNFIVKDLDIWKYSIYYFLIENDKFSNCNILTLPFYKFENYLIKYFNNNIFKFFLLEIKPKLNILDFLQKFNSSFKIYNQLISVGISQSEISNIVNLFNNNDYNKSKTIISTTTPILPIDFPKETEKLNFLAQIDCNDFKHCLQSCILPNFCNDKNTNGIFYLFIHTEYYNNTDNGIVNLIPEKSKAIVYYYNGNSFQLNFDSNIYKNISTYGIFNNNNKCWKEDLQLFMTFEQKEEEEEDFEPSFNMLTCSSNTLFGSFKDLYNKEDYNDNKKEDNKEDDDYIFLFKGLFYSKEVMEEYVDVVKPIAKIYISRRELFELCEKCDREGNNDFIYRFNNTRLEINKFVHY